MDKYEKEYENIIKYEESKHEQNIHKIKVSLKLYIIIPLVFLIFSFFKTDAKLVFLVLWVASLFILSVYMIYIEYSDHNLQKRMKEYREIMDEDITQEVQPLLEGRVADRMEHRVNAIDETINSVVSRYEAKQDK